MKKINFALKSQTETTRGYMVDMLLMLIVPAIMSFYYYGFRAIFLQAVSMLTAVVCEWVACKLMRKKSTVNDLSALFTGWVIALLLPASLPFWMPALGAAFAIIVAKIPFGNVERVPFVPAAVGVAFLTICWPETTFIYPAYGTPAVLWDSAEFVSGQSLTSMLKLGTSVTPNWFSVVDIIVGRISGPMGTTCVIVAFFMAVYLLLRRPNSFIISASFMAAVSLFAVLFPRVLTGRKFSLMMEVSSGIIVFVALLLMTDPATAPKSNLSKLLYGFCGGTLAMLLRYFGPYEEGACFAVMLANAIWPIFDPYIEKLELKYKNKKLIPTKKVEEGVTE